MRAPNRGDYAMREPISPRFRTGEPCLSHAPEAERRRGVNLSLRIKWRARRHFAKPRDEPAGQCGSRDAGVHRIVLVCCESRLMSPEALNSFFAILIGFALAGALTSGFQAFMEKPPGFGLLMQEAGAKAFAAVPFLVFAAPFIIMRNTVRGRMIEGRRVQFVAMATVIAGFWSMMSGTFVLMLLETAGLIA